MGREFIPIFSDWAAEYDETVAGKDEEYRAVLKYEQLLAEIAEKAGRSVVEFGSGTGNLTQALLDQGKNVLAIEPSPEMRRIAKSKPSLSKVTFVDGDMEVFLRSRMRLIRSFLPMFFIILRRTKNNG